jgi:hypothetical protein
MSTLRVAFTAGLLAAVANSGCVWHLEVRTTKTERGPDGIDRTRRSTWVVGGPQHNRWMLSECQADSQCKSGYCHLGTCQPEALVPTDGLSQPYHVHLRADHPNPEIGLISPRCEHDNPDVRGIEEDRYGRYRAELPADRRGCRDLTIGDSQMPAAAGDPLFSHVRPPDDPWDAAAVLRAYDAEQASCLLRQVDDAPVFDCWPWGAPYQQSGRNDFPVPEADRARLGAIGRRDVLRFVPESASVIWLDGPAQLPNGGYGPPYAAARGDFLVAASPPPPPAPAAAPTP